jgi:hypothetical protein
MRIEVSREEALLDTGGGLKKAAHFFVADSAKDSGHSAEPFILHNVDVLSTIDLRRMVQFHTENQALATLATQGPQDLSLPVVRRSPSALWPAIGADQPEFVGGRSPPAQALAFSGIHVSFSASSDDDD